MSLAVLEMSQLARLPACNLKNKPNWGLATRGVPYRGPYFKGILYYWGLFWGGPLVSYTPI